MATQSRSSLFATDQGQANDRGKHYKTKYNDTVHLQSSKMSFSCYHKGNKHGRHTQNTSLRDGWPREDRFHSLEPVRHPVVGSPCLDNFAD